MDQGLNEKFWISETIRYIKLIGVQSNHGVEYFGGPASPHSFDPTYSLFIKGVCTAKLQFFHNFSPLEQCALQNCNLFVILTHESSVYYKIEFFSLHFSPWEQCALQNWKLSNSNLELGTFLAPLGTKSGTPNILQLCSLYMTMPK